MISWDGFEDAIIGTITPFNGQETLCYRYRSMIDVLVSRHRSCCSTLPIPLPTQVLPTDA